MADHNDGDDEDGPATEPGDTSDLGNVVHGPWWVEGECPSASIFAEYLDDCLPEPQRQRVYDHLCECSRCRHDRTLIIALLLEIASLGDEGLERAKGVARTSLRVLVGPWADMAKTNDDERDGREADSAIPAADEAVPVPAVPPTRRRHTVTVALAAACLAALVAGGSVFFLGPRASVRGDRPARTASAQISRPLVARFTGRFPWAPVTARSGGASANYDRFLPSDAVRYLLTAERRGRPPEAPNPSMLGMVGASQVLTGRVEPGVETLRRAAAAEPRSAALLSDLGAALLARAEASGGSHDADYAEALEVIDRALEIAPHHEEALFNRALALERLYLPRSARQAWRAYLDTDPSSKWSQEAGRRMSAIVIPARVDPAQVRSELAIAAARGPSERLSELVLSHRQLARRFVQEEVLPDWGEAWLAGEVGKADRQLGIAQGVADEWEVQTGDRTLREAIDEIERATGAERTRLALGYRYLGQAYRAFAVFDIDGAQSAANRSLQTVSMSSPAHTCARLVNLVCAMYRDGELESEALSIVDDARDEPASVGRAYWILGLWHAKRGDVATGLTILRKSLTAYERIDEVESIAWLHFLMGDAYGSLGATDAGWRERRLTLQHAQALTGGQGELTVLVGSATLALVEGRAHAAADLLREGLIDPPVEQPGLARGLAVAQTYLWRSRVMHELGRDTEARGDLQRAASWLGAATPTQRRYLAGDMSFAAGLLEADPGRAVEQFSRALVEFRDVGPAFRLPGLFLARARAHLRAGSDASADSDLRQGLHLLQHQANLASSDFALARRLDNPEELSNERIQLSLRRGDTEAAFAQAEANRSQGTLPLPERRRQAGLPADAGPTQAREVAARLEAGTTLLFYSWLPDRVVVWRLSREGVSYERLAVQPMELAQLVSAFDADLKVGAWTTETAATAKRLYSALLGPARLSSGPLVIVPDGALHELPFGATINPQSTRFLVEEREVAVATSAGAFLGERERWQRQLHPPTDALVIGDPRVDAALFPDIRALAGARNEAREVAALYPHRELLLGGAATREAFLNGVSRRPVIHFAGHAMINRIDPARTSLPLASGANGSQALLTAADIARLDLSSTSTVVLSGCETGVGEDGEDQGPLSLARAFLVAGTPTVVASFWPIADAPSAPLMTAFHRRLRMGERPPSALRGAQLELLRSGDPILRSPGVWAAFAAIGG